MAKEKEGRHGIASRVLATVSGGNLTRFAFDAAQGLTEHTSPFDALVMVLDGSLTLTIGGTPVRATPGTIVRTPAGVPHALDAPEETRMLLPMLRDPQEGWRTQPTGRSCTERTESRSAPGRTKTRTQERY